MVNESKFGKYVSDQWYRVSLSRWIRYFEYQDDAYHYGIKIFLSKIDSRHGADYYVWYPEFVDELVMLQNIYDETTSYKEFNWNEEVKAMEFIDQFVSRMDKLWVFT